MSEHPVFAIRRAREIVRAIREARFVGVRATQGYAGGMGVVLLPDDAVAVVQCRTEDEGCVFDLVQRIRGSER